MDEPRIAPKPTISRILMAALCRRLGESVSFVIQETLLKHKIREHVSK